LYTIIEMETEQDTSKMLLTVSSFGESLRRLSTGGGVFNEQVGRLVQASARLYIQYEGFSDKKLSSSVRSKSKIYPDCTQAEPQKRLILSPWLIQPRCVPDANRQSI
jgi:hypothetical protein